MTNQAGWLADPAGRHEYRYWDGAAWTEHVADNGQQTIDPLPARDSVAELRRREVEAEAELAEVEAEIRRAANSSNDARLADMMIAAIDEKMSGTGATSQQSPINRQAQLQEELASIRRQLDEAGQEHA